MSEKTKTAPKYADNQNNQKPVTVATLAEMKAKGLKITMVTAYDYPMARLAEEAGVDSVLVGDSVAMTKLGYDSTLPVTMDEMLHHVKAARRGLSRALLIADMPFSSYELDAKEAARNAARFVKDGGAQAVKLEGGSEVLDAISAIVKAKIPAVGHLGLTPQAVHRFGGYRIQGRSPEDAQRIFEDAVAVEAAGASALVLECVPAELAQKISRRLKIPAIGIGAGPDCDGQVLVSDDLLGLTEGAPLKFVKRYADLRSAAATALSEYCRDVRDGAFPAAEHSFTTKRP